MKNNKILQVLIFALFALNMSFCQSKASENKLLGEWKAYKKTTLDGGDGSDVTLSGSPYTVQLELKFLEDNEAYFINEAGKVETDYTLKGDTLRVSHFTYSIVEISPAKLVLKEEKLMGGIIYLKKIDPKED